MNSVIRVRDCWGQSHYVLESQLRGPSKQIPLRRINGLRLDERLEKGRVMSVAVKGAISIHRDNFVEVIL